jgi:hypothetical protein
LETPLGKDSMRLNPFAKQPSQHHFARVAHGSQGKGHDSASAWRSHADHPNIKACLQRVRTIETFWPAQATATGGRAAFQEPGNQVLPAKDQHACSMVSPLRPHIHSCKRTVEDLRPHIVSLHRGIPTLHAVIELSSVYYRRVFGIVTTRNGHIFE